jgi:monofunctional biosynthetic peptidoglycan transglycosylase
MNLLADPDAWRIVNDGVMGGVSSGRLAVADDGALRFTGEVRLDHNGGFASVRRPLPAPLPAATIGLRLRTRGDGNRYRLTVYTRDGGTGAARPWHAYAVFETRPGEVRTDALRWAAMRATFRGRPVPDAVPPVAGDVLMVGFMITKAEHRAGHGAFALDVLSITPLAEDGPPA